ncbi:MAG: hypothetical protein N3A01_04555 [Bacteroidales bacterium]|nr:hypothetical protein [Bacteroidales bacterium]
MKKLTLYLLFVIFIACGTQQNNEDKKTQELQTKKEVENGLEQQSIEFERDTTK